MAIRLNNLASLLQETNHLVEAEQLMRKSLEIILHSCVTNGCQSAIKNYTTLLQQMGRTEAEALQHVNHLAKAIGLDLSSGD